MTINPINTPSAALPPSVKGGGNAPSKRPASGDPFASVIAQISGADEAGVAGNMLRSTGSLASRTRGTQALEDVDGSAVPSKHDTDDAMIINVAVPAWLWTVQEQPGNLGPVPLAQPQTAAVSGSAGPTADTPDSTGSSDPGTAPGLGMVADLFPGMEAVPLVGVASRPAASAVRKDQTGQLSPSPVAAPVAEQSTPTPTPTPATTLPTGVNGVPSGLGAGAAPPTGASSAPADRSAGPAVQSETTDSQVVSSESTDQPATTQSRIPPRRAGRVPAAYADAANAANAVIAQGLRPAGQSANGVAPPTAFSSSPQAGSSRITDNLRASTDRANGGAVRSGSPTVLAVGQAGLAAALVTGRAQSGTAQNPAGQDSAHSSPDSQGRAEDSQASMAQALDAPVAQTLDAAVAGAAVHPDHAILQTSQAADHVSSLDRTTPASAASLLSSIADRSAAIDDASLHRQMVQAIHLQSRNGIGDAQITLQPEYLGEVTIALRVEDGGVTAHVSAASTEVREWLGANESLLRHGLSEQGLTLDRLIVSDEPAAPSRDSRGGNARQQQSQQDQQEPRPRPRRDTSTFEITV